MKKYIQSLNEFFAHLSEEEAEDAAPQPKTPEEEEEEREKNADDLERDYNIFKVENPGDHLDYYNDLVESLTKKLGISYEGPYSCQESTVAKIGDKTPLNYEDWNNVYYRIFSESNDNPDLFLEFIVDPDALESYMDENGKHWPDTFIYTIKKKLPELVHTMDAKEADLLNWLKKEFD